MQKYTILWADDEIQLLKAHILFLEQKGYDIKPVNSGVEALELVDEEYFDLVFLDENMPGMSGLEVLAEIKEKKPQLPVVMITKSEEEFIMEEAIGAKISDYLIKPLNPNQILLSVKKILDNSRIVSEKTNSKYQRGFQELSFKYNDDIDYEEWCEVYKKLVNYEIEVDNTEQRSMKEVLSMQKAEANKNFTRFIKENYGDWIKDDGDCPLLSHHLMAERVFPHIKEGKKVFFILIDNLRLDQWNVIQPLVSKYLKIKEESLYYSMLPTTTAYARNAIFSGMFPSQIAKNHPEFWVHDDEEEGKNKFEENLLNLQIQNNGLNIKSHFFKIFNNQQGEDLVSSFSNLKDSDLVATVFNFVDMLSHARTDTKFIKELAKDEAAYRSLTKSWFEHSPLLSLIKELANSEFEVILTTDHGTIRVDKPQKIIGDRNTNTNLRYKQGKNLTYDAKNTFVVTKPEEFGLPKRNISTSYVFATDDYFFAYPNNYNHYVKYFKDTFQHGGVSMEEVLIPVIHLTRK